MDLMNAIEKLEVIKAFEATHDVTAYKADGWHVWPLVRILLGFNAFPRKSPTVLNRVWMGLIRPMVGYLRALIRQSRGTEKAAGSETNTASVVFLTQSGRRVWWRECFYEIYTDPLIEILKSMDKPVIVWEVGDSKMPQYSPSHKISIEVVDELYRTFAHLRKLPEPGWFSELQPMFIKTVGRSLKWEEVCGHIVLVTEMAKIFERKLSKIQPKIVIAVCWYSNRTMALTLAASRLGISTVELQHGVQGRGHFAYSGWQKYPPGGYEVFPDIFWCWGRTSVHDLIAYNPGLQGGSQLLIGGNPWLNRWRSNDFSLRNSDPGQKTILVTLQHEVSSILLDAIKKSPQAWDWMIRFHPIRSTKDRETDCALFAATGHKGVKIVGESDSLLYELFQNIDVHITESSTCALEAMAFGVGTIVVTDTAYGRIGKFYFDSYINRGVMCVADTAGELLAKVQSMAPLASTYEIASDYFAESNITVRTLEELLSREHGTAVENIKGNRESKNCSDRPE
ncbi:hypothetical protein J2W49_004312 [Hydrogenophaga palleronii]|uniref:Capsule polysaccharide biosynthesis protein n=1 Tax=Hydrogenophaga palleronii TaxID=65655 RepID=A0ABU1WST5_9BURK|nr:hypothetical protein [Hydrogenophaga palleronii]MDR7152336.1 hypothetical protein [Hydrogenophaga palleronii]